MGYRPMLLNGRQFWGRLAREVHPNSSYCSSVVLENRAGTMTEPDGGKFSSPVMQSERRIRFRSWLQGLFPGFVHIQEKYGNLSSSAWIREYLNIVLY